MELPQQFLGRFGGLTVHLEFGQQRLLPHDMRLARRDVLVGQVDVRLSIMSHVRTITYVNSIHQ